MLPPDSHPAPAQNASVVARPPRTRVRCARTLRGVLDALERVAARLQTMLHDILQAEATQAEEAVRRLAPRVEPRRRPIAAAEGARLAVVNESRRQGCGRTDGSKTRVLRAIWHRL